MKTIINLLQFSKDCKERPVYHPEKMLNNHIGLVTLRAMFTGDKNMIACGILHDIAKPLGGEWIDKGEGLYWSNNDHAKQSAELIRENDDIRYWLKLIGCDWELVANICQWHMAAKEHIPKRAKHIPHLDKFVQLDNMIFGRKEFPVLKERFFLPNDGFRNCTISYIGQSPVQTSDSKKKKSEDLEFTVCIDRTPLTYKFSDIPQFFVGQWDEMFGKIIKSLL